MERDKKMVAICVRNVSEAISAKRAELYSAWGGREDFSDLNVSDRMWLLMSEIGFLCRIFAKTKKFSIIEDEKLSGIGKEAFEEQMVRISALMLDILVDFRLGSFNDDFKEG